MVGRTSNLGTCIGYWYSTMFLSAQQKLAQFPFAQDMDDGGCLDSDLNREIQPVASFFFKESLQYKPIFVG